MMTEERFDTPKTGLAGERAEVTPARPLSQVQRIARAYLTAALEGNRVQALHVIGEDGPAAGLSINELYLDVIQASQYEIGRLWAVGEISVAQEHVATAISQLAIAQLFSMMPKGQTSGRRILIACVPGETHDMGPRILADFFEMAGFEVRYLGADVPALEVVSAAEHYKADLIALSATMSYNLPAFRQTVAALRERLGDDILIAAGGQAFDLTPELLDELGIPIRAADAGQLVERSRAWLENRN